jgi:zinc protease
MRFPSSHSWRARALLFFALLASAIACLPVAAQTPIPAIPGLSSGKLDNGLEVYLFESHVVPLVRIQITFRCGSITQVPETAGLFHLYEHMMFKGNSVYKTESDVTAAMTRLGVANWNGGTSTEYVTYYFTVPSAKLGEGLDFWSAAVETPLLDPAELETEKDVVINEIRGYFNEPDQIFDSGVDKNLYAKYPYRRDVSGSEANVRNATAVMMRSIKDKFYLPNNAAVFVGGDIEPAKALELVRASFGGWTSGPDPWAKPAPSHPFVPREKSLVYSDDSMTKGMAKAEIRYRGPDVLADPQATYAADVWGTLIANPSGRFKNGVFAAAEGLYQKEYINGYYETQRDGGSINFDTYLFAVPEKSTTLRAQLFKESVKAEITAMVESADSKKPYFTEEEFAAVKSKLEDQMILLRETPEQLIENLSFWWASANADYYFNYVQNMKKVGMKDIAQFLKKYVLMHEAVVAVRMCADDFAVEKPRAAKNRFEELTKNNAFWWNK